MKAAQKVKKPPAKGFHPETDKLAAEHLELKQEANVVAGAIDDLREKIDHLIEEAGVVETEGRKIVRGENYQLELANVMSSPSIKADELRDHLQKTDPKLAKRLFEEVTHYVLKEDELMAAAANGAISQATILKFTKPSMVRSVRLNVGKVTIPTS